MNKRSLLLFVVAFSFACASSTPLVAPPPPPPKPFLGEHGFVLSQVDRSVSPCDNFYEYAVGGWRKANPLPAIYPRYGRFEEVSERNRQTLRQILESAAADAKAEPGSATQKIGAFWTACMNESAIESQGVGPIREDLDRVDAIDSRAALVAELHRQQAKGVAPVFRFTAQNDIKSSKNIIAAVSQGGLGLPDREYYLRDDERFKTTRREYVAHLQKMFELAGVPAAKAATDAERVMALETALARASMARADQRKPENTYHLTPLSELQSNAPLFQWPAFFNTLGLSDLRSLNVAQPEYIREANRLLDEMPLETWKAYLRWNVLDAAAPYLSSAFVNQDFAFRQTTLSGTKENQPRWQRCVRAADANIGEILGQEYVKRAFTPEAKEKM
ncbi:MAG TPA: M13 family metallopeptidase N-terminal domain-containing protein, partial [Thermoanaerobaculia bacterium]|nr:M13 family metallopeptidase N-terminal domain-containing protein [Thermoanaerobaculia bacterium]